MLMFFKPGDISALRQQLGMTLKQFGDLVGVTDACVCYWEQGSRHPKYEMQERLNQIADEASQLAADRRNPTAAKKVTA